ncbi:sugar transporter domain-containing protein [Ditylenchus destructor]|uniref:Sugar transporter domain-containing protein n=1 Tax=Ditylenchus destructor TaxID=166010 RepID=A0AAD4MV79_9BILA|nr:sugar transporter domain-containing protein [Ditylenchus destructor]
MFLFSYYVSVAVVTIGGSSQFYSYDVVNPEQEILTSWINETFYERDGIGMDKSSLNIYWSVVVSSIAIGAICGALMTKVLAEKFGRRNALIANGVVNVTGALMELFAKSAASPELLIIGRFILGANMGLSSGLVPMYLLEITPTKYRGMAGTVHQIAVAFSDWFSLLLGLPEVLGSAKLWPLAFGFPGLPAFILCIILPFCPESPKFTLIAKGSRERALSDLERLVDKNQAKLMFEALVKEATLSEEGTGGYREMFSKQSLRFPLFISIWMMIAQQFTGCGAVFAYSTDMFLEAQLAPEIARYSTLVLGIGYFIFACSSAFLIERVGRRCLSIFQLGFVTMSLTCLSLFTWIQKYSTGMWASYGSIGSLLVYMCVYGVGSPIPWMITGEIFPTKFRSAAMTCAIFVSWSLVFIVSLVYLPFKQTVGVSLSYLPFIIVSAVSTCFVYFMLPETKNKHSEEIADDIRSRTRTMHSMRRRSLGRVKATFKRSSWDESEPLILADSELPNYKYCSLSKISNESPPPHETDYYLKDALHRLRLQR